jgi:NTE family protein
MDTANPNSKRIRIARSQFEQTVLLLQGGGALGSYQPGVYQALAEADLHPDWVAGISIGAINAALIAGNPSERRVERLREFWEAVSTPPLGVPHLSSIDIRDDTVRSTINQTRALGIMMFGAPHFFTPRLLSPVFWPSPNADQLSLYDVAPLKATLERLVDFDRLNAGAMRFSVGAQTLQSLYAGSRAAIHKRIGHSFSIAFEGLT